MKNLNIVFLDEATVGNISNLSLIKKLGNYKGYDFTTKEQILERIADADIVITNKVVISRELIEKSPLLKLICVAATGVNNIDLEAAKKRDIPVKNVAGYSTDSVVQTTFSLLFELLSHTSQYNDYIHSGDYSKSQSFTSITPAYHEISGKRYGIIGLGNIGSRVAAVATAFGADVSYYSTSGQNYNDDYNQVSLDELLRTSDIISIHSPLNESTRNLINKSKLNLMKKSAYIINVGRGGIIVEEDLADALESKSIAGAGLDVFTQEPILESNPLMRIKDKTRLVMTPHIAWASVEARERLLYGIADNIIEFMEK